MIETFGNFDAYLTKFLFALPTLYNGLTDFLYICAEMANQ